MKKKVLLTLIPALMILGSCAGNAPQVKEQLFQEDTLLHDEVFGSTTSLFGKARRNALPEDDSSAIPTVGVQKAVGETTVSVRFIAATNLTKDTLEETEAVWTRTMYDASGNVFKIAAEKASLLTYTALRDGSGTRYTIKDFNDRYGTNYNSFVVYTMLNIPKTTYDNYYLNAYLTLTPSGEVSTYSQTLATNVSGTKRISFPHNTDGYFLKGTLNGNAGTFLPQESTPEGKNARFVFSNFKANDTFFIGYNHIDATPANSKFIILDSTCLSLTNPYFTDDGSTNHKIKSVSTHAYSFNINSSNQLADIESGYTVTFTDKNDSQVTVPLIYDGVDGSEKNQFYANVSPQTGSTLIFNYDNSGIYPTGESGANVDASLNVICGGADVGLWFKEQGNNSYTLWANYPSLVVTVDETILPVASREETGDNVAIYDLALNAGQELTIYRGYLPLQLYGTSDTVFTAPRTADYIVYVNGDYVVVVNELFSATFTVDMTDVDNVNSVSIAGDFNGWDYSAEMTPIGNNKYSLEVGNITNGTWPHFRFAINGNWENQESADRYIHADVNTTSYTYKYNKFNINTNLSGLTDAGAVIYAWIWNSAEEGNWYAYDSENQRFNDIPLDSTGMNVVRFASGTITPNWEGTEIWNQSEDLEIHQHGTLVFTGYSDKTANFEWRN